MKKKIVLFTIAAIVLCCLFFVVHHFFIGSWTSDDIDRYIKLEEQKSAIPNIDDLGEYSDIEFKYQKNNMLFFFSDAYILKISYDNENYKKEKEKLLHNYVYETEAISDFGGYDKEPCFEMDSYSFKMLSAESYNLQSYPHDMVFFGFSDKNNKIAIIHFFDSDLDYIDNSFPEFLKEECGWE